jgi:hypothetical protein
MGTKRCMIVIKSMGRKQTSERNAGRLACIHGQAWKKPRAGVSLRGNTCTGRTSVTPAPRNPERNSGSTLAGGAEARGKGGSSCRILPSIQTLPTSQRDRVIPVKLIDSFLLQPSRAL